jgi:hypothetical protein
VDPAAEAEDEPTKAEKETDLLTLIKTGKRRVLDYLLSPPHRSGHVLRER